MNPYLLKCIFILSQNFNYIISQRLSQKLMLSKILFKFLFVFRNFCKFRNTCSACCQYPLNIHFFLLFIIRWSKMEFQTFITFCKLVNISINTRITLVMTHLTLTPNNNIPYNSLACFLVFQVYSRNPLWTEFFADYLL